MILIFDLFETLIENLTLDFNLGLKPFWEEHYKDKCSFDEIKAYGEELFVHMQDQPRAKYFLTVDDFNPRARKLYENLGYKCVGELPDFYKQRINCYLMMKTRGI